MTDEQAMWRLVAHEDHSAFACLVERWEEPIRRLCTRMVGDTHRGEDLKQEVFVRVFTRRHDFRPDRKFSTWLWRIALNVSYDELRRLHRRGEDNFDEKSGEFIGDLAVTTSVPKPDEQVLAEEESALVRDALLQLNEKLRTVLVLRHYEGLKFREIADIVQEPEGTVTWRAGEALAQMHRLLAIKLGRESHVPNRASATASPKKEDSGAHFKLSRI